MNNGYSYSFLYGKLTVCNHFMYNCNDTPLFPTHVHPLLPFHFLRPSGDQLDVRGGQRTFLGTTRIRSGGQEKIKQMNKHDQCLGWTKSRRRICNTTCMCGLTLAWVTSENSTSNWNTGIFWLNLLRWTLSCLLLSPESTASVCGSTPTLLLTRLSAVPSPTTLVRVPSSTASQLLFPLNPLFVSPYHFRIRRDFRSKNHLSGFAPKQTKESSARATHIVLHNLTLFKLRK